jgi:hypothetical protein
MQECKKNTAFSSKDIPINTLVNDINHQSYGIETNVYKFMDEFK